MKAFLKKYCFLFVLLAVLLGVTLINWTSLTVSDRVLLLTLAAILWYTWETYLLRVETSWATELANRPFINVQQCKAATQSSDRIVLENIGKGCAVNLQLSISDTGNSVPWNKKAASIGSEKTAEFSDGLLETYLLGTVEGRFFLRIVYDDLAGKQYYSYFEFDGKENLMFLESGANI